jgi:hypothetical protein
MDEEIEGIRKSGVLNTLRAIYSRVMLECSDAWKILFEFLPFFLVFSLLFLFLFLFIVSNLAEGVKG